MCLRVKEKEQMRVYMSGSLCVWDFRLFCVNVLSIKMCVYVRERERERESMRVYA